MTNHTEGHPAATEAEPGRPDALARLQYLLSCGCSVALFCGPEYSYNPDTPVTAKLEYKHDGVQLEIRKTGPSFAEVIHELYAQFLFTASHGHPVSLLSHDKPQPAVGGPVEPGDVIPF